MAGSQVSKTVAINWFIAGIYGYEEIEIDEYSTNSEPQVLAGSRIEIGSELYYFASDEAITGWAGLTLNQDAYIKFVPSGTSCTVEFTQTAPTWSALKRGWYDGNDRYIYVMKHYLSSTSTDNFSPKIKLSAPDTTNKIIGEVERDTYSAILMHSFSMSATALSNLWTELNPHIIKRGSYYYQANGIIIVDPSGSPVTHDIRAITRSTTTNDISIISFSPAGASLGFVINGSTATTATGRIYW